MDKRQKQIDFLNTCYNKAMVDAAVKYADSEIEHLTLYSHDTSLLETAKKIALEVGQEEVADLIEMQMDFNAEDVFNALTFAYVHGMSDGLSNPSIGKTPKPASDYALSKDFAFIFNFHDNDFGEYIGQAAQKYCDEYNKLLKYIQINDEDNTDINNPYKKDLQVLENPDNVRQFMKAAFIGEYMTGIIDRCFLIGENQLNATEYLNHAQDLANNYFNFETNTRHCNVDDTDRVDWKFGTWEEVSKFGLEEFKNQQSEEERKNAKGDFFKYWLNGEVLIVRMVDGKLVSEVH